MQTILLKQKGLKWSNCGPTSWVNRHLAFERIEGYARYAISFDIASEDEIRTGREHGEGKEGEWSDSELEEAVKGYLWMRLGTSGYQPEAGYASDWSV